MRVIFLFIQSGQATPHILDVVDIASLMLVTLAIVGAFILANAHIANQSDVQEIIKKYDDVRLEVSLMMNEVKSDAARVKLGFQVTNLREEQTYNLSMLKEYEAVLIGNSPEAGSQSLEHVDRMKARIEKYKLSISARERELQLLFSTVASSKLLFEELQTTYGDYRTIEFLKEYRYCISEITDRDLASTAIGVIGHRLINRGR